jgi:PEP-CTERM motif-containing protein
MRSGINVSVAHLKEIREKLKGELEMKRLQWMVVLAVVSAVGLTSQAALVSDDFEDGDYTSNPTWTPSGTITIETNDPGTTNGNHWAKVSGSHGNIQTDTGIAGTEGYTQVAMTARILFTSDDLASTSNYITFYLISDDGNSYMKFLFYLDDSTASGSYIYSRKDGSSSYTSDKVNGGITAANTWYDVKCVWNSNNYYEMWIDGGSGLTLVVSGTDTVNVVELGDLENVRYYTRGPAQGLDDIVVTPEPATMVLLGLGGVGLLIRRRRRS